MHTAREIAYWFLAWADQCDAACSNLKVQKLLYYAQGHFLGDRQEKLFPDTIQAWAHGPVIPTVYHALKTFGSDVIDTDDLLPESFSWDDYKDVEQHLLKVWETYGGYEAWVLRNMTHRERPWIEAFDKAQRDAVISEDALKEFFGASLPRHSA